MNKKSSVSETETGTLRNSPNAAAHKIATGTRLLGVCANIILFTGLLFWKKYSLLLPLLTPGI